MTPHPSKLAPARYAKAIEASKRVRWDIDRDVLRGRRFEFDRKFLPDGLSLVDELPFLDERQRRLYSQIQGRTYAGMFGMVERFIGAKTIELGGSHGLGDQVALEALVRMTDEELKHQELFRRIERMLDADMPHGYRGVPDPNAVAEAVLGRSSWAVLGLTLHIELFTQAHYRASIDADPSLSELWKDVFRFHWREESQHAILDELEWVREDARLAAERRDDAIGELIGLIGAVDAILQQQARADADYFGRVAGLAGDEQPMAQVHATMLKAYRWQYIMSGVMEPRFQRVLGSMVDPAQMTRIREALAPLQYAVPAGPARPVPMAA